MVRVEPKAVARPVATPASGSGEQIPVPTEPEEEVSPTPTWGCENCGTILDENTTFWTFDELGDSHAWCIPCSPGTDYTPTEVVMVAQAGLDIGCGQLHTKGSRERLTGRAHGYGIMQS